MMMRYPAVRQRFTVVQRELRGLRLVSGCGIVTKNERVMQRPATNEFAPWWWPPSWLRIIARLWLDQRSYRQQIQQQFQDRQKGLFVFSQVVLGTVLVGGTALYPLSMLLLLAGIPAAWSSMAAWSSATLLVLLVLGVAIGWARGTSMYGTCGLLGALLAGIGQAVLPWLIAHNAWVLGFASAALSLVSLGLTFGIFFVVNDITQRPRWLQPVVVAVMQVVMLGLFAAMVAAFKGRGVIGPFFDLMWGLPAVHLSITFGINIGIAWAARQLPLNASDTLPAGHLGRRER